MADHPEGSRQPTISFGGTQTAVMRIAPLDRHDPTTPGIARGSGCSYGDQSLCSGGVGWRAPTGILADDGDELQVGAGTPLRHVVTHLWPTGRSLAVLPGSLDVTVGGAVAADVHGKNHVHMGSFAAHVRGLELVTPTGTVELEPGHELFDATTGGMGLTGVVRTVRLASVAQQSAWAHHRQQRAPDGPAVLETLAAGALCHHHAAAWIDLLGPTVRGVVSTTDVLSRPPTGPDPVPLPQSPVVRVPRVPVRLVRRTTMRAFNELRWRRVPDHPEPVPLAAALTPLGAIGNFNHAYGPAGLVQHQCLVPDGHEDTLLTMLELLRTGRALPALAVLKRLGPAGSGHLSFPAPGWTLAVDLPADSTHLPDLVQELDRLVLQVGGRIYLAKDSTATPEAVAAMHPRLHEWRRIARAMDPQHVVTSDLDRRLHLRAPAPTPRS